MNEKEITLQDWEAVAFFGFEPVSRAYGSEWYDSDSLYEVVDSRGIKLSCAIHPIHKDVRICMYLNEEKFYDWQAQDLEDIWYVEEKERTVMKFIVSDRDIVTLQVKPKIIMNREQLAN